MLFKETENDDMTTDMTLKSTVETCTSKIITAILYLVTVRVKELILVNVSTYLEVDFDFLAGQLWCSG